MRLVDDPSHLVVDELARTGPERVGVGAVAVPENGEEAYLLAPRG